MTRLFILWTAICCRLLVYGEMTCDIFVDLANFFDTINVTMVPVAAAADGCCNKVTRYIRLLYSGSEFVVKANKDTADLAPNGE